MAKGVPLLFKSLLPLSTIPMFYGSLFLFAISQILSENSVMAIINIVLTISILGRLMFTKKTIYVNDAKINNTPRLFGIYPDLKTE